MDTTCAIGIDRSIEELPIEFLGYALCLYVADIQGALVSIRNPFVDSFANKPASESDDSKICVNAFSMHLNK